MNRIVDYDKLLERLTEVQKEICSYSPYGLNSWKSIDDDTDLSDKDKIAYAINEWVETPFVNRDCSFWYNPAKKTNYKPKTEIKEEEIIKLLQPAN